MKYALRDLGKLGIKSMEQLEQPLPVGILVEANVVLKPGDDGVERNELKHTRPFDVVDIEQPEPEPFAIRDEPGDGSTTDADDFDWETGQQTGGAEQ
jgi:hypothetical protein